MTSLSKTYYVSSKTGNDSNDGLTSESAFASLFAINHRSLQPGDQVLLERGCVFHGQYPHVTDSGREEAPIVIGAYGAEMHRVLRLADREFGIRIMGLHWIHRPMCITDMYLLQFCCMMQNISL